MAIFYMISFDWYSKCKTNLPIWLKYQSTKYHKIKFKSERKNTKENIKKISNESEKYIGDNQNNHNRINQVRV